MPGGAYTQHKEAADNVSSPEHCEQATALPCRQANDFLNREGTMRSLALPGSMSNVNMSCFEDSFPFSPRLS